MYFPGVEISLFIYSSTSQSAPQLPESTLHFPPFDLKCVKNANKPPFDIK